MGAHSRLHAEDRIKHTGELNDLFAVWLKERSKHEIYQALRKHGVPGGPVRTMEDIFHCEQMRFRDFFDTVSYPDGEPQDVPAHPYIVREAHGAADDRAWRPGPAGAAPPRLGADTAATLAALDGDRAPRSAPAPRSRSWPSRRRGRSAGSPASASSTSPGTRRGPTET